MKRALTVALALAAMTLSLVAGPNPTTAAATPARAATWVGDASTCTAHPYGKLCGQSQRAVGTNQYRVRYTLTANPGRTLRLYPNAYVQTLTGERRQVTVCASQCPAVTGTSRTTAWINVGATTSYSFLSFSGAQFGYYGLGLGREHYYSVGGRCALQGRVCARIFRKYINNRGVWKAAVTVKGERRRWIMPTSARLILREPGTSTVRNWNTRRTGAWTGFTAEITHPAFSRAMVNVRYRTPAGAKLLTAYSAEAG